MFFSPIIRLAWNAVCGSCKRVLICDGAFYERNGSGNLETTTVWGVVGRVSAVKGLVIVIVRVFRFCLTGGSSRLCWWCWGVGLQAEEARRQGIEPEFTADWKVIFLPRSPSFADIILTWVTFFFFQIHDCISCILKHETGSDVWKSICRLNEKSLCLSKSLSSFLDVNLSLEWEKFALKEI